MKEAARPCVSPPGELEVGDRFPVLLHGADATVLLPESAFENGLRIEWPETRWSQQVQVSVDPFSSSLRLNSIGRLLPAGRGALWLELCGPHVFRLVVEDAPVLETEAELKTEQGIPISLDPQDAALLNGVAGGANRDEFQLALRAARLATHGGFDRLMCLPLVRDMDLLDHQTRTARTVLRRFRGRAMLCAEVGLGKTIEAGLILSELVMRGLARSVLILVPPSLIEQWQGELIRKFSLSFTSHDDPAFRERGTAAWGECQHVIASIHTAKREPHRSAILDRKWDLVIIDEAHHLRNRTTQLWKFASELRKQFILLLTATPVQNNLDELFNLVTLLEPGLLSTSKQFQRRFVDRRDKLTPKNVDELHALLGEVMVRNRRSTVGLQFTRRWARTELIPLVPAERKLYDDATTFVRKQLQSADTRGGLSRMALLTLQMTLGSSSRAAAGTLERIADHPKLAPEVQDQLLHLASEAARQNASSKADRLLELLGDFPDKMVIFTQFRATQEMLAERLIAAGHNTSVFHGGLSRMEKETAVNLFRGPARLLLATEAGSEGRNLQFAHAVCNFDLPWNPMKIEQRIGRLSRIGQAHDVHVFNLVATGTVEAAVLHLLEAKLNMFELVIGEIDMILGNLEDEREFPEVVGDVLAHSADAADFASRMEELGNRLLAAKTAYFQQRQHDDKLFGNKFAPEM